MKSWYLVLVASGVAALSSQAAPPQQISDLQIKVLDSTHLRLDWSPVDQDTSGNPLDCVFYDLHLGQTPNFVPSHASWIDSTSATTLDLERVGELGFFCVQVQTCAEVVLPELVLVPAGHFIMGHVEDGVEFWPEREVSLTHDFLLGRTEVSNAQFLEALNWAMGQGLVTVVDNRVMQHGQEVLVMDAGGPDLFEIHYSDVTQQFHLNAATFNGDVFGPGYAYPDGYDPAPHPVANVSWYGAACYCDWRSQMAGLPTYYNGNWSQIPQPGNPYAAPGYRLPTEAEWEFAAQSGDERMYPWGNSTPTCSLANHNADNGYCVGWTSPVGVHPAGGNALGLQDMAGNVFEWCNDWAAEYGVNPEVDPSGPDTGSERILRGGSWNLDRYLLSCSFRWEQGPARSSAMFGFRLCRTLP